MAAESASVVNEDIVMLREAIKRISGGGDTVTFGELAKDEAVEQHFEALLGTLKASRKRGLIDFEGELLLVGQHDDVPITITDKDVDDEATAPAAVEASTADTSADRLPEVGEAHVETAEAAAPEEENEHSAPEAEAEAEAAPAVVEQVEEPASAAVDEVAELETSAPEPAHSSEPPAESAPPAASGEEVPVGSTSSQGGKWKVDTSYVDWRTADPDRKEVRRGTEQELPQEKIMSAAKSEKDKDGKWTVDTSYVNHRTTDVENLEGRKGTEQELPQDKIMSAAKSEKDKDGKWTVNTSYVNHRTTDVDNLDGRKSVMMGSTDSSGAVSGATKKDGEGKWKVDMSYINHRTGDTDNMDRKDNGGCVGEGFSDPAEKKYPYEELKGAANRPADVDPAKKEQYLSDAEFEVVFGIPRADFDKMPKWKQQNQKKAKELY